MKKINVGYIEDGVLKLRNIAAFKRVVYELTYQMKGWHMCYYCGKRVKNKKITIDHLYPQNLGGITITNNLVPACAKCNSEKSNMTLEEYNKFLKIQDKYLEKEYWQEMKEKKEDFRKNKQYQIPEKWLIEQEISKIFLEVRLDNPTKTLKYKKVEKFYAKYGYFQRPIVVDKNGFLLDGFYNVIYAKIHGIETLQAVRLENVEVIF